MLTITRSNSLASCWKRQCFSNCHLWNMKIILTDICWCPLRHKLIHLMPIISNPTRKLFFFHQENTKKYLTEDVIFCRKLGDKNRSFDGLPLHLSQASPLRPVVMWSSLRLVALKATSFCRANRNKIKHMSAKDSKIWTLNHVKRILLSWLDDPANTIDDWQ